MAKNDNESPTVEVVRAVAEKLARDTNRSVSELTVPELIKAATGSAGYIGAHLQTIKIEHARAARFDTSQLPIQLISGLCEILEHFQKRGEEIGRAEGKITQELYDQVCQSNNTLETRVADLAQQLTDVELARKAEKLDHDTRMQAAQVENQSLNNSHTTTQQLLAVATNQLNSANYDLGVKTARVGELEALVSTKDKAANELNQRLSAAEEKYQAADTTAKEQKQRADLLSMRNDDLSNVITNLETKLAAAIERAATAEAQLVAAKTPKPSKGGPGAPAISTGKPVSQ